jgi:hypothetical protein
MAHEPKQPPSQAQTLERYCADCGQITVWYLAAGSAGATSGTGFQWVCTGQPADAHTTD